jgi:large repetitive protein
LISIMMRCNHNTMVKQMFRMVFVLLMFCFVGSSVVKAQSSTQVNIVGVPPILSSPFADDIENKFRTGQYQVIFNYSSFNNLPVDFVFNFVLVKNNRTIVDITSAPRAFTPGSYVFTSFFEENEFRETPNDVIRSLDRELQNQIIQSGAIPEGNYSIEITARPFSQQTGINPVPGRAIFSVRYPPPPILVSVPDGANLIFDTPVFSWTPVVSSMGGMFEYEFLMVEVLQGQSSLQAINSNREHVFETLTGQTTLPYTLEYLPLEEGAMYAWRVRARDVFGNTPLQNDGESEIYTFTYRDKTIEGDLFAALQELTLVPNFIELINLDDVRIEETALSYIISGPVDSRVRIPGTSDEIIVQTNLVNFEVQKGSGLIPVILDGYVEFDATRFYEVYPAYENLIRFTDVEWSATTGLTAGVDLITPDRGTISAEGELILTPEDVSGYITAYGSPLYQYEHELVTLELTNISALFPGGNLSVGGDLKVAGVDTPCSVSNMDYTGENLSTTVNCSNFEPEPLFTENSIVALTPSYVSGNFSLNRVSEEFVFDISVQSSLDIEISDERSCSINFLTSLKSDGGMDYQTINQSCNIIDGGIDLGFAKLALQNVELNSISYNSEEGEWDFDIEFDTRLSIEQFGGWESPWFENTRLTNDGISFQEQTFVRNSPNLPDFDLTGYRLRLEEFVLREFTFPLFDWDREGPGPWEVEFAGDFRTPESSLMPRCFSGIWGRIYNGRVTENRIVTDIDLEIPDECTWEFGAGYAVQMNGAAGTIGLDWSTVGGFSDIRPFAEINVDGSMSGGFPHRCSDSASPESVQLTIDNGINASIEGLFTDCPIDVGPFEANLISSNIKLLWSESEGQQGFLSADIGVKLPNEGSAQGSVEFDIINGRILDASVIIQGPFQWDLPHEDAVLSFLLDYAEISGDGLLIDGRQQLVIGEKEIGVTFDKFVIDLETLKVHNGRIIFDEQFAFEAGIDGRNLSFKAVPVGHSLDLSPGLYMELGAEVMIDSTGLSTSGEGYGIINYGDKKVDSKLEVRFSKDFRMGLFPFSVQAGEVQFLWDKSVFARIDREGFHPDPMFFADMLIPERLPLPSEQVAYIQLREDDQLLINLEELGDGLFSITSIPDQPLSLVLPVLDAQNPPTVAEVQIIDLVISGDPINPGVVSGSIIADLDPNHEMYDLTDYGFPLQVHRLLFGDVNPDGLGAEGGLYLEGKLNLFGSVLEDMPDVGFYLQNSGDIEAEIFSDGFSQDIELVPGSDRVTYRMDSFYGNLQGNLKTLTSPSFNFELFGSFQVNDNGEKLATAILDLKLTESTFNIEYFDAQIEALPSLNVGNFELDFHEITSIPELSYTPETGFTFAASLDLDLVFNLSNGESFLFPLSGFEIGNNGIVIPEQNIHSGSPAGLQLPSFQIFELEFQPLALRTLSPLEINWFEQDWSFNPDFEIDFALRLPEFEDTSLHPSDGLTFNNVGFNKGFLTGSVEAHFPLGGAEIPLGPQSLNPPVLQVNSIGGSLDIFENEGELDQEIELYVDAQLTNLPRFSQPDQEGCDNIPELNLAIVEGRGFQGSLTGYTPCGNLELGPIAFEALQSDLYFDYQEGRQLVWIDGEIQATLPSSDETNTVVTGSALLNLITGNIMGGQLEINDAFQLGLGPDPDNPIFDLALQQAIIDSSGLTITGDGNVVVGDFLADLNVNDLKLDLSSLSIVSGSAVIESGIAFDVNLGPVVISGAIPGSAIIGENVLRFDVDSSVELNASGLAFSGGGSAELIYGGESFTSLGAIFEDDFVINFNSFPPSVASGRAEFILEDSDEPIVIWDTNGFQLGGGLVALLPDRIGLPTESIAYVDLVDEEGNPLLQVESNEEGGYTLSTGDQSLPIFIPAISSEGEEIPSILASFSLTTDGQYNIIDGSISISEDLNLQSKINLPVSITGLDIGQTENGVRLQADVKASLPSVFQGSEAYGTFIFEYGVGFSGTITAGYFAEQWGDEFDEIDPLYSYEFGSGADDDSENNFRADLYGVEISVGQNSSLKFASAISSSVFSFPSDDDADEGQRKTLFLSASYTEGSWDASANVDWPDDSINLGLARFIPDNHNAVSFEITENRFVAELNGTVSFVELLDDELEFAVQGLQFGVEGIQSSPSLVFGLGEAAINLPDQEFNLLSGTLTGEFQSPQISFNDGVLSLASSQGNLNFLQNTLSYEDFIVSTSGQFGIGNIGTDGFDLFEDYITLQGLGVTFEDGELSVGANFQVQLPEPVDQTAEASIFIKRAEDGTISVESTGPDFDFEGVYSIADLAEFRLHDARVNINISDPLESSLYANGSVLIEQGGEMQEVITFGNPGNSLNEAGISFQPSRRNNPLRFNATGNYNFSFEHSFFQIDITANGVANSTQSEFLMVLNGNAGIALAGVSGRIGYEGFTVSPTEIVDIGNFSGEGELSLMGFASLGLGQFYHTSEETTITINSSSGDQTDPSQMDGNTATESITVTQLLCFGEFSGIEQCAGGGDALSLSLGGDTNTSSGGISGGIEGILFYETITGDKLFYMNGFSVEVSEVFSMNATLQYESTAPQAGPEGADIQDGMLLRVAAAGQVKLGDDTGVSAVVAGKFENRGGLSFGLFAAVESSAGIPIVPGVVELTGLGGGFFYRPTQDDLSFIHGVIEDNTDHTLQANPGGGGEQGGNLKFAAMLYARVGIAGAGGITVVQGSTYFEVTNQSFYLDVYGTVMGMGGAQTGSPANLELTAGMYLSMIYQRNNGEITDFLLEGGMNLNINIPVIMTGSGEVVFFAGQTQATGFLWGIEGEANLSIYGGILSGYAEFLASDIGFLFEGGLTVALDIPIISFEAALNASIWYIDHSDFAIPFGGYATARIEICLVLCGEAQAVGAFAHQGGNQLNLYAYGEVGPLSGYVSIKTPGPQIDYGSGRGDNANLIEEAMEQRDRFAEYIDDLRQQLTAAMQNLSSLDAPTLSVPSADEARRAGYRLMTLNQSRRNMWANIIRDNETYNGATMPGIFDTVLNNYVEHDTQTVNAISQQLSNWVENFAEFYQLNINIVLQDVLDLLTDVLAEAAEVEEMAELAYDEFLSVMSQSPVSNIQRVNQANYGTQAPSFQIDEELAISQAQQVEDAEEMLNQLGLAMLEPIKKIESVIEDMETLLFDQPIDPLVLSTNIEGLGDLVLDVSPSVLGFAEMYSRAITYAERFYSYQANEQWVLRQWAIGSRLEIGLIESTINSASATLANRMNSSAQRESERVRTANRVGILNALRVGGLSPQNFTLLPASGARSEARNFYNQLENYSSSMELDVIEANQMFWYNMFSLGLDEVIDRTEENLQIIYTEKESAVDPLRESLISLTNSIEDFYDMKANTFSILYGMTDNLVTTFDMSDGSLSDDLQSELAHYSDYRQELALMLQPPDISGIIVTPNRPANNFFNEVNISWQASHPHANGVQESAIQIEGGSTVSQNIGVYHGVNEYMSLGRATDYNLYTSRTSGLGSTTIGLNDPADNTHTYNVGVRVRGPAGTTSTRRGQFNVSVGMNGETVSPGYNAMPEQLNPPNRPIVLHSRNYLSNKSAFWTNDPQLIRISARATDNISGINRFEYAIGTTVQGTDVVDWTLLSGGSVEYFGSGTVQITADSRVINMEPGTGYYVSVRAVNGAGLVSDVSHMSLPVKYDPTPPSNIQTDQSLTQAQLVSQYLSGDNFTFVGSFFTTQVAVYDPIFESPNFENTINLQNLQNLLSTNRKPKIGASWSQSTDSDSGIAYYEYVVTNSQSVSSNDFETRGGTTTDLSVVIVGGAESEYSDLIYNFEDSVYLHVRAMNYAGSYSNTLTYELQPPDLSRPAAPVMRARPLNNEILLHVTYPSADPESGLKGYQYSIGTSPGSGNIRPFPSSGEVDINIGNEHAQSVLTFLQTMTFTTYANTDFLFPYIAISTSGLPTNQNLYFNYRTVNNQGGVSATRSSGPIVITNTPPQTPQISVSTMLSNINLTVSNIHDPVSGVTEVEYRVFDRNTGTALTDWSSFVSYDSAVFTPQQHTKLVSVGGKRAPSDINVSVRVRNVYGRTKTELLYSAPPPPKTGTLQRTL